MTQTTNQTAQEAQTAETAEAFGYTHDQIRELALSAPGTLVPLPARCQVVLYDGEALEGPDSGEAHYHPTDEDREWMQAEIDEARKRDIQFAQWRRENDRPQQPPAVIESAELRKRCSVVCCAECGDLLGGQSGQAGWHLQPDSVEKYMGWGGWQRRPDDGLWICPDEIDADDVEEAEEAGLIGVEELKAILGPIPAPRTASEPEDQLLLRRRTLPVAVLFADLPAIVQVGTGHFVAGVVAAVLGALVLVFGIHVVAPRMQGLTRINAGDVLVVFTAALSLLVTFASLVVTW
jgi:hypothetical protein